ncbi:MAG: NAD(P)H-hydrate dehydratase [Phascolarctobacterium sp.]
MKLVTAQEMKEIDQLATEKYGIPGLVLMDAAAKQVADEVMEALRDFRNEDRDSGVAPVDRMPALGKVVVLCGGGNNGGDGFGAARWLACYGVQVKVFLIGTTLDKISGDAAAELAMVKAASVAISEVQSEEDWLHVELAIERASVVVDAIIGTGFSGELRAPARRACQLINRLGRHVLSVDMPTGVNADDGSASEDAVRAETTVTMELPKTGFLLYPGKELAGDVCIATIGMPTKLLDEYPSGKYRITPQIVQKLLPVRAADAHKGDAGRVVVCAGSPDFTGAAAMSANAAVKAGAGLVSLLTPLSSRDVLALKLTEVMVHGLLERSPGVLGSAAASDVLTRANKADVLAIGPGLGLSDSTQETVRDILSKCEVPVVIDADAITALKEHTDVLTKMTAPKVLTPHAGEMSRLTGLSVEEINRDRINIARKYAQEWQAVVVLKGAPTVVACPNGTLYINSTGTKALATGGSGDVLTGIIAGLAAQGISLTEAAVCGVYLHGAAGSMACEDVGLAADEISSYLCDARDYVRREAACVCTRSKIML